MRDSLYHLCKPRTEGSAVKLHRPGLAVMLTPILMAFSFPISVPLVRKGRERGRSQQPPAPGAAPSDARGSPGLN